MCDDTFAAHSRIGRLTANGKKVFLALCKKYQTTTRGPTQDSGKSYYASVYAQRYGASGCCRQTQSNLEDTVVDSQTDDYYKPSYHFTQQIQDGDHSGSHFHTDINVTQKKTSIEEECQSFYHDDATVNEGHCINPSLGHDLYPTDLVIQHRNQAAIDTTAWSSPSKGDVCCSSPLLDFSSEEEEDIDSGNIENNDTVTPDYSCAITPTYSSSFEGEGDNLCLGNVKRGGNQLEMNCDALELNQYSETEAELNRPYLINRTSVMGSQKRKNISSLNNHDSASLSVICENLKKHKEFCTPVKQREQVTKPPPTSQKRISSYFKNPVKEIAEEPIVELSQVKGVIDFATYWSHDSQGIKNILQSADAIVFGLTYSDGTTQLRENSMKRKKSDEDALVKSVIIGSFNHASKNSEVCSPELSGSTYYLSVDLCERSKDKVGKWDFLTHLMSVSARKICFDAQEFVSTLTELFGEQCSTVCTDWLIEDPKVAMWLLNPDAPPTTFSQLMNSIGKQMTSKPPKAGETDQNCLDLQDLYDAMNRVTSMLKDADLWELFMGIEIKLIPLLSVMEVCSLRVDMAKLKEFGNVLAKKLSRLEIQAYSAAGQKFALTSPQQLRQVLFEVLKLDSKLPGSTRMARTASGNYKSTCESVLNTLKDFHPLPAIVLQYRQLQKLKSTYVDGILSHVHNGQLSTHWDHTAAVTGRLTSTNPNIQAIPKVPVEVTDYEENFIIGKEPQPYLIYARETFIAQPGWSYVTADFCQIELRLLAHFSGDPALQKVFEEEGTTDIFKELTSQWLEKDMDSIEEADRERTKRVVYSIMYGAGKKTLGEYLKVKPDDASAIMQSFLVKFPGVGKFTSSCIQTCRSCGFTRTLFNRRRLFPAITSISPQLRAQAERQAVNFCIQGSAADLCKAAMLKVYSAVLKHSLKARLVVQIHDELLIECPDVELTVVKELLKRVMEDAKGLCGEISLKIPLRVVIRTGKSWAHMSEK